MAVNKFDTVVPYLEEARDRVARYKNNKNKTTKMFIEEMRYINPHINILGDYISAKSGIDCRCLKCGYEWMGVPNRLLGGTGCPKCGGRVLPTMDDISRRLLAQNKPFSVSGDLKKSTDKLSVVCNICESTWQSTYAPLFRDGYICKTCRLYKNSNPDKSTIDESVEEFRKLLIEHSRNFTLLTQDRIIKAATTVEVRCNDCGREWEGSSWVISRTGCAKCSRKEKQDITQVQKMLDDMGINITVSGEYINTHSKIDCLCRVCGCSWKSTRSCLKGSGCPSCARTGYDPRKPGILYYIRVDSGTNLYWKIGITNLSVRKRFQRGGDIEKITILMEERFDDGKVAQEAEKNILRLFKSYSAIGVEVLQTGNTELFTKDILQMDHLGRAYAN
jgi:protein-arginine kinase activator protein McsA